MLTARHTTFLSTKRKAVRRDTAFNVSFGAAGFTLVELVAILMIVGILAMVAVPRFFDQGTYDARAFSDKTKAMLRYGQKLAIARNTPVYVLIDSNVVALCLSSDCSSKVTAPAGKSLGGSACSSDTTWYCHSRPTASGVTSTVSPAAYVATNPSFYFNALGKPFNRTDVPPTSNFTSSLSITVTGGGVNRVVKVENETGYVY